MLIKLALEGLSARKARETRGGRSRTRTYDLAHVRRADSESNLLELLTNLFLEASVGDE
jgi:hypothetical protein